jgi:apolipoprotein N-acyltransferase
MRPWWFAVIAAVCFNLAFAPTFIAPLALVGFALLWLLRERSGKVRFLCGWCCGFLTQLLGFYWVFFTIRDFGGIDTSISAIGAALFFMYQGLDFAVWLAFAPLLFNKQQPVIRILGAASFWMLLQSEWFPYPINWSMGSAWVSMPVFRETTALWTMHGLNFFTLVLSLSAAELYTKTVPKRQGYATVVTVLILIVAGSLFTLNKPEENLWRIAVIQPALIDDAKRGAKTAEGLYQAHAGPTEKLIGQKLDLVVWPETALAFNLRRAERYQKRVGYLAKRVNAGIVTGAIGIRERKYYYNEIWLFDPDQPDQPQVYQKERLFWFSEALPWVFSWANYFSPGMGAFRPGQENQSFKYRDIEMVPLVCFEALFPRYARKREGELYLNLTNDAWFSKTKASRLHLQHLQMRSPEMNIPLIRATNSGISCWLDRHGRVQQPTPLYQEHVEIFEVPVPKERTGSISHIGDWIIRIVSYLFVAWGLMDSFRRRKGESD